MKKPYHHKSLARFVRHTRQVVCHRSAHHKTQRKGAVLGLTIILLVAMVAFVALALDLGYLAVARTELQRTADSAAMAAAWELVDADAVGSDPYLSDKSLAARNTAVTYAGFNDVISHNLHLDENSGNDAEGDIVIGQLATLSTAEAMAFGNPALYNVVHVRARRDATRNGEVPLFFARILGFDSYGVHAEAKAGIIKQIGGFRIPSDGSNQGILPFALDEDTWQTILDGTASDQWTWDADTETISPGGDGVLEVNLFPQGTGSPGNRGTVDVGSSNNSTNDIARQILHGVTPDDLAFHGGSLEFDENGELFLNGDTGISAGVKDELHSIRGEPRVIPVYREVQGPGNNAMYTIVKWVGVRIMEVKLNGSQTSKRVVIQPANVVLSGVVPTTATETSYFIYSPPVLIQ